ncbi:hypothetical protein [Roseateles oligotrophus]|uniref:Uncharacterized protein n=1 Tax=Roseateles oligotrophus TaxID=1769250 RepID=A0ABT2YIR5_9BURK|nr:hypothetical protein [Roseateles oligotrophus]MCV2369945.1 hypothetical protein [Roseateles oligotrophus]
MAIKKVAATKAKGHDLAVCGPSDFRTPSLKMATVFLALVTGSRTLPNLQPVLALNERYCAAHL